MALMLYNSLTEQKEEFKSNEPGKVKIYVCGMTVYDLCHIGHARANIVFDIIYRYLQFSGYEVTYVRNITDIDDKIIAKAKLENSLWSDIAQKYSSALITDLDALEIAKPTFEPKATDHIDDIIDMIKELITGGYAYEQSGSVYFSVSSFDEYGELSGKNIDELLAGARVQIDESKQHPADFALWKLSKLDEPYWDSPWGKGRPGWHIECSAMGRRLLGRNFDIHGGGKDLIFPHHENEIAQSKCSSGLNPANYWIHNGFVTLNKNKMSKSSGNFFTIREILKIYEPEAVRLFLLSSHYRSQLDFANTYLNTVYKNLVKFYQLFANSKAIGSIENISTRNDQMLADFTNSMDDDFNTAKAIANFNIELKRLTTTCIKLGNSKLKSDKREIDKFLIDLKTLKVLGSVLGLFQQDPEQFFLKVKKRKLAELNLTEDELAALMEQRFQARKEKNFAKADSIRADLAAKGITLQDSDNTVTWDVSFE
ncbi:MAG: cysteine--tRNA ligase [Nitrospinota bacterium]